MGAKQEKYIQTAIDVISRYGVRRATMGDIATEAGVSRQTLYASYASKEEILAAAVRHFTDAAIQAIQTDWANLSAVGKKLDVYFNHAIIVPYGQMNDLPDASDLFDGAIPETASEISNGYDRKKALLVELFTPYEDRLSLSDVTPEGLAELVQSSSTNFKFIARDNAHLSGLLASLKAATLALLLS